MPGVAGRSGRRRKPLAVHLAQGSYRPDRHGPLPESRGSLAVLPVVTHRDPAPRDVRHLVSGLARAQQTLARRLVTEYQGWSPTDLLLLRLALEALDRRDDCRRQIASDGIVVKGARGGSHPHPLLRQERAAAAFAAATFRALILGGAR